MTYEFKCPKCGNIRSISGIPLKDYKSARVFCDKCSLDDKQVIMIRILSAHPKHSSWSNW